MDRPHQPPPRRTTHLRRRPDTGHRRRTRRPTRTRTHHPTRHTSPTRGRHHPRPLLRHVRTPSAMVRSPPRHVLAERRRDRPEQPRPPLQRMPPADPQHRLATRDGRRRPPAGHPARHYRPRTTTHPQLLPKTKTPKTRPQRLASADAPHSPTRVTPRRSTTAARTGGSHEPPGISRSCYEQTGTSTVTVGSSTNGCTGTTASPATVGSSSSHVTVEDSPGGIVTYAARTG